MSTLSEDGARRVLTAALTLFARHGFQRTSMADIARAAGIARATLYLRFADKRAVFAALCAFLVRDALDAAAAAWSDAAPFADNLEATILAKDLPFFRLINGTPHGAELMAVDAELTRGQAERLDAAFIALLAQRAAEAQSRGADLGAFDGAEGFGAFMAVAAGGLKHETRDEAGYRAAVRRLARVAASAARVDAAPADAVPADAAAA